MKIQELSLTIPSGKVAAIAFGDPNNKKILAAHGWLDNAASFTKLAPLLQDYYVVSVDLPGHGLSEHRPDKSYFHFIEYVADLIHLIDVLSWQQCYLLGHSLGAAIFTLIAGIMPERFSHVALIDALGPFVVEHAELPKLTRTSVSQYSKISSKRVPSYATKDMAIAARLKAGEIDINSVRLLVDRGLKQIGDLWAWRTDPRLLIKPLMMFTEDQIKPFLENITAKVCLIRATSGWPFSEQLYNTRINLVKNLEIHKVSGGHHLHLDDPSTTAKILNNFFASS